MRVRYSVTFEFEMRPPLHHRGTVEGTTAGTCARRAIGEAHKALRPVNWASIICVLHTAPHRIQERPRANLGLRHSVLFGRGSAWSV